VTFERRRHTWTVRRALVVIIAAAGLAAGLAACGAQSPAHQQRQASPAPPKPPASTTPSLPVGHPQVVQPVAGEASAGLGASATSQTTSAPASTNPIARPVSDAMVRQELAKTGMTANANQATLTPDGLAVPPVNAPPAVQQIILAGNEIAHLPYVWGGGHVTYADTGYDCSGSISFVFQAAHLLDGPVVSGALASWGAAGAGKWITVFANGGHTFMYIAGLRFDTVALAQTGSRWSNRSANESNLGSYAVRHPIGL
jgi:cell wall-associated NlpC family hydrolase